MILTKTSGSFLQHVDFTHFQTVQRCLQHTGKNASLLGIETLPKKKGVNVTNELYRTFVWITIHYV